MRRFLELALVASLAACARGAGTQPAPASARVAAAAAPAPAAVASPPGTLVRCDAASAGAYADWRAWLKPLLDDHGALDREKTLKLGYKATPETERMLRRGLEACDPLAPAAITATFHTGLERDVTALLAPNSVWAATPRDAETAKLLRLAVVRAANSLWFLIDQGKHPPPDHSDLLVPLLSDASERVREDAISTAQQVPRAAAEAALLERVQHDAGDRARREAAANLLAIGDVYPRAVEDHADLMEALAAPPKPAEVGPNGDGFWTAALILRGLGAERRASGSCSPQRQPARIHTRITRLSEKVTAVGLDEAEGSCGTYYGFVVFVEASPAIGNGLPARLVSDADPARLELPGPAGPIPILYERAARVVRVGGVEAARGDERVALVSVEGRDIKVTLRRDYLLFSRRDGDVFAEVWEKLAPLVSTAPATAFETPWPATLPCAHPTQLRLHRETDDDVSWSSRDGKTARTLPRSAAREELALERGFPVGALDRITSRGFPVIAPPREDRRLIGLTCPGDAAISWGPCADGRCAPAARYRAHARPMAPRTQLWTAPMRYPHQDEAPEIHYSLFKKRLGYRKAGDPEIARQSVRLAHDLAADLLDLIRVACPKGRCSQTVLAAEPVLVAFMRDRSPRYALLEHLEWYDHWNSGWYWTLTSGGREFKAGCGDITESPEVFCSLEFEVGEGLRLTFEARNGYPWNDFDVALFDRNTHDYRTNLGAISYTEGEHHEIWVEVTGRALATP